MTRTVIDVHVVTTALDVAGTGLLEVAGVELAGLVDDAGTEDGGADVGGVDVGVAAGVVLVNEDCTCPCGSADEVQADRSTEGAAAARTRTKPRSTTQRTTLRSITDRSAGQWSRAR
jgi:hypothetical protein